MQVVLIDVATVVTQSVRNVERKVVATLLGSNAQQLTVLRLTEVFVKVHV